MKKVMLFLIALFFSVSASAATINLTGDASNTGKITHNSGSYAAASGTGSNFSDNYKISATEKGQYKFTFTANPFAKFSIYVNGKQIKLTETNGIGSASYIWKAIAGTNYNIQIKLKNGPQGTNYNFRIAAVPVPAAAMLFAPALIGFVALRRKAVKAA